MERLLAVFQHQLPPSPFYFIIFLFLVSRTRPNFLVFFFLSLSLSTHQTQNLLPHLSLRSPTNPQRAEVKSAKTHPFPTAGREIEPSSTPPSFFVQGNPLAAAGRSLVVRAPPSRNPDSFFFLVHLRPSSGRFRKVSTSFVLPWIC